MIVSLRREIALYTCEYDCARFLESLRVLDAPRQQILELGYDLDDRTLIEVETDKFVEVQP